MVSDHRCLVFLQRKLLCEDFQSKLWALYRIPLESIPSSSSKLNYNCLHDCLSTLLIPLLGSNPGLWSLDSMFLAQYLSYGRHSSNSCWVNAIAFLIKLSSSAASANYYLTLGKLMVTWVSADSRAEGRVQRAWWALWSHTAPFGSCPWVALGKWLTGPGPAFLSYKILPKWSKQASACLHSWTLNVKVCNGEIKAILFSGRQARRTEAIA